MVIHLGNVYSTVVSCTPEEYLAFRECLTIPSPNYWFSPQFKSGVWDGMFRFYKGKSFQTGLLHIIQEHIPNVVVRQAKYPLIKDIDFCVLKDKKMTGKYSYQADSVLAMLNCRRGIIANATGSGKTVIAAAFLQILKKPTLFLTHQVELARQTKEAFEKSMSLPIGLFGAGIDDRKFVTVGMVPTLYSRVKNKDREVLSWLASREVLIVDECHLASSDSFLKVMRECKNAEYRLGLSATALDRDNLDNLKVKAQLGVVVYEIQNQELEELNVLSKPLITMVKIGQSEVEKLMAALDTEIASVYIQVKSCGKSKKEKAKKTRLTNQINKLKKQKYAQGSVAGIVDNLSRNSAVVALTKKLLAENKKTLLLVKRIKHGEILQEMLKQEGIVTAFCSGRSSDLERDTALEAIKSGKSSILILSKIGQVGLDVPILDAGIYCGGGKSSIEVVQSLGRYLRNPEGVDNTIQFYDFYDEDSGYLLDHSQKRKGIYERKKFSVECCRLEKCL